MNNHRLFNKDGSFKPSDKYIPTKDKHYSIGYLEELCEWIYYRDDLSDDEKMIDILNIENILKVALNGMVGMKIVYTPTWSVKLEKSLS